MSKIVLPIKAKPSSSNYIVTRTSLEKNSSKELPKNKISLPIIDINKITSPIRDIVLSSDQPLALYLEPRLSSNIGLNLDTDESYSVIYQPGDVAMPVSNAIASTTKVFTNIFPSHNVYAGQFTRFWDKTEEKINFIMNNSFFFGLIIQLFKELFSNLAYQSYLLSMSVFELVQESPVIANKVVNKFNKLVNILTNRQLRGMWWLNLSLDIKILLKKIVNLTKLVWNIISKFYLLTMLVICVGFLHNATPKSTTNLDGNSSLAARSSILEDFLISGAIVDNTYEVANANNSTFGLGGYGNLITASTDVDESHIKEQIFTTHKVNEGEYLEEIAAKFNVDVATVAYNNNITNEQLEVGKDLRIPIRNSTYIYKVRSGDSLEKLSNYFSVELITITSLNADYLEKTSFNAGIEILLPTENFDETIKKVADLDKAQNNTNNSTANTTAVASNTSQINNVVSTSNAKKPKLENVSGGKASGNCTGLIWPTGTKYVSQYPSRYHMALDIASRSLPPIYAAADGVVLESGWDKSGYGNQILVSHGNGCVTRYAHNSQLYVRAGEKVTGGQVIAKMGSTGNSTGPHLHFECKRNGKLVDPYSCM